MVSFIHESENVKTRLLTRVDQSNVIRRTHAMKHTTLHYTLFLIFLVIIILRNRFLFYDERWKSQTEHDDVDDFSVADNVGDAYMFIVQGPVRSWRNFSVLIYVNDNSTYWSQHPDSQVRSTRDEGGSVFRVQAYSNVELVTTMAVYVGGGQYMAQILLSFPTTYTLTVHITYTDFKAMEATKHVTPLLHQVRGSPFQVHVREGARPPNITKYCSRNESGRTAGRWVKCGGSLPHIERCGAWTGPEFDFDKIHGFHWLPYACQHHQYTNDEVKRCFAREGWKDIVFAGDSHMRYRAYHWATRLYGRCHSCAKTYIKMVFDQVPRIEWIFDARGTRLPLTFTNITLPLEKYMHSKVRRSKFSKPFPPDAMHAKLFIVNFGHWLLRETNDVEFLHQKLHAYGRAARMLVEGGAKVVWVNTNSLPWRTDAAVVKWRENTSPYRVWRFNRIADDVIREYGIPTVDAFQISDGRIASTHDQTHFTKKLKGNDFGGVVENAITNAVVNLLCNEQ